MIEVKDFVFYYVHGIPDQEGKLGSRRDAVSDGAHSRNHRTYLFLFNRFWIVSSKLDALTPFFARFLLESQMIDHRPPRTARTWKGDAEILSLRPVKPLLKLTSHTADGSAAKDVDDPYSPAAV